MIRSSILTVVQPRQVRTPRGGCKRQAQPDEVVSRIAYDRLIEIANLKLDLSLGVADQSQPISQSPQIQIAGPSGSVPLFTVASHS
jgi:hypothetical protein